MTQNYKKKLIEVALPLEAINAASAYEKMPGIGAHPRGIHHWWARRPLVACRAVLFAQLVNDPSSNPERFPTQEDQETERLRLFEMIEELVKWENSQNEPLLLKAQEEILRSCGGELPPIYDPFSGGGSIPLEAQRLGLPAYGSDLNPVAVMIGKAMIEIPPKFKDQPPVHPGPKERTHYRNAEGLAEDIRYYGEWMLQQARERIGHLYPTVALPKERGGGDATVIAWIWARTVPSPDPAFADVQVPIASTFLLNSKVGRETWIEPVVDKVAKTIRYRIRSGGTKAEIAAAKDGTKAGRGANFRCLMSDAAITMAHVRTSAQRGLGETLIAIVAEGPRGRIYVEPTDEHVAVARSAEPTIRLDLPLSPDRRAFTPPDYGMATFGELFTDRQLVALGVFSSLVHEARLKAQGEYSKNGSAGDQLNLRDGGCGSIAYAEAVSVYLEFAVERCADFNNSTVRWNSSNEKVMNLFARQVIPMAWDFGEANILEKVVGGFEPSMKFVCKCLETLIPGGNGSVVQHDAQTVTYPSNVVISTDPPYYDNIGYADLSDFFFCWMRPALRNVYPELFGIISSPKKEELIASPYRHGGREEAEAFFLEGMKSAIGNMAQQISSEFPTTIYYAFKQSEVATEGISSTGWATFLDAVVGAGFSVVRTWPIRSEQASRMRAAGSNALANSVVLVCRKRQIAADTITRAEFVRALKREIPGALAELQAANIAPADMPQSAIGPGVGVFSRYNAVLESDDTRMSVKTALQLINRELDEYLGGIQGEFDPDTRFAISWFEQNGNKLGDYGVANSIAQARGISVESVKHAGIVDSAAGKVRILTRDELDPDWDPQSDAHLTVWECCQYLVRALENEGETRAAGILKKIGSEMADAVKDLAYCLYGICEKRSDAKEATSYNALIAVWTELTRQAATIRDTGGDRQTRLDL